MTYVTGISQFNINAIICDTYVSWWRDNRKERGENIGFLKSGLLFPGCIYGISGSIKNARAFIINCRLHLTGRHTLPDFWEMFLEFFHSYCSSTNKNSDFQLLLSSRNHGIPQFYVLDSKKSAVEPCDKLVSLGSGKPLLDQHVQKLVSVNTDLINNLVTVEKRLPLSTFPYLYCLWLNELSQGMDLPLLEKYHVGGIFHFLWQDANDEHTQLPAVYVLSDADPKEKLICSWIYRVAYAQDALIVDNPITNTREVVIDPAARPNFRLRPNSELKSDITRELNDQPFYYFCGFGFADPKHRGEFGIAITNEGEYHVDKDGSISPDFKALIQDKFSRDYKLVIGQPNTPTD
jgi:hypothetical protein